MNTYLRTVRGLRSSTLRSRVSGEMKEAKLREVNWPDVNKETFIRLCEFAYLQIIRHQHSNKGRIQKFL
jgi:hypothetical protein